MACVVSIPAARGEIVYDNSNTPLGTYFATVPDIQEFGDEVSLEGNARLFESFRFEYYGAGLSGNERARIKFYANDGPLFDATASLSAEPMTLLYQSDVFNIENGLNTVTLTEVVGLTLPDNFTWSLAVVGLDLFEVFGLSLYGPETAGDSFDDFWRFNSVDGWTLNLLPGGVAADFGATITAVPEPSVLSLFGLGVAAVAWRRLRQRKA
jgi:hypothetical protein